MPKLRCPCGFVHDMSPIPDDGWNTIRDVELETFLEKAAGGETGAEHLGLLYECRQCGRVMWKKPGEQSFGVFTRDEANQ